MKRVIITMFQVPTIYVILIPQVPTAITALLFHYFLYAQVIHKTLDSQSRINAQSSIYKVLKIFGDQNFTKAEKWLTDAQKLPDTHPKHADDEKMKTNRA